MKQKQGSGLIITVVLLFVILAMVVTLSSITVLETKMGQKTKSSVGAFYNSESGVEWALNQISTKSGPINSVFSGIDSSGKIACPDFGSGESPCDLYFLDAEGNVINNSNATVPPTSDISLVKAVRSVGTQNTGEVTQRAIEAAVASGGNIPKGGIIMWSGTLATIPSGWALCDGTNGTPDLRSKFVFGAPSGSDPGGNGSLSDNEWVGYGSGYWQSYSGSYGVSPDTYFNIAFIMEL